MFPIIIAAVVLITIIIVKKDLLPKVMSWSSSTSSTTPTTPTKPWAETIRENSWIAGLIIVALPLVTMGLLIPEELGVWLTTHKRLVACLVAIGVTIFLFSPWPTKPQKNHRRAIWLSLIIIFFATQGAGLGDHLKKMVPETDNIEMDIVAPTGGWSKPFPNNYRCDYWPEGPVKVRIGGEDCGVCDPQKKGYLDLTKKRGKLQFQAVGEKSVKIKRTPLQ